jgi:uracil-DNA glycosylase
MMRHLRSMTHTPTTLVNTWLARVDPSWLPVIERTRSSLERAATAVIASRAAGKLTLPPDERVLRALEMPLNAVRVLIVGQDPYPTVGNAVGLAFSTEPDAAIPASLRNIFRELRTDVGVDEPASGDLSEWAQRGVLLLNRVLVVDEGTPGSLRKTGWEEFTLELIRELASAPGPLVAILWGNDAAALGGQLRNVPKIVTVHPSPLAAHRGFFGSKPFSRANAALIASGGDAIDWSLRSGAPTLFDSLPDS